MKATGLFKAVVLIAIFLVSATNSFMNAQENNFVTNEEIVDNVVKSKTIYRMNDGVLFHHMKYDFTYDDQSRMTSKEVYKWNGQDESWTPYFKMSYTYSEKEMTVVYARWNAKSKAYDLAMEKSVYELNKENAPVAFFNYKWKNFQWVESSNHYFAMDGSNDVNANQLLACN